MRDLKGDARQNSPCACTKNLTSDTWHADGGRMHAGGVGVGGQVADQETKNATPLPRDGTAFRVRAVLVLLLLLRIRLMLSQLQWHDASMLECFDTH